jgi:anti-sigma factor RsiW
MKCNDALQNIILAQYGELPDELQFPLEQHLGHCEDCRREWNSMLALQEDLALAPLAEPSPNLLAASRMALDEALDALPPRSFAQRFTGNAFRWLGFLQGAPALATLLVGVGFLGGNLLVRYQVSQIKRPVADVWMTSPARGPIASVSGIVATPDSDLVQVNYNRIVPESVQGTLDDPQIRQILMLGTKLATNDQVHEQSVQYLAGECRAGHDCGPTADAATDIRKTLLASLRYDTNPKARLQALAGLQRYVADDQHVRNAVLDALLHDKSPDVRIQAVNVVEAVQADSSVRHALRTVSEQDANPAIRTASFQVLQGSNGIE